MNRKTLFLLLSLAALPTMAGLWRIWVYQDIVQLGYKLTTERQRLAELATATHTLELELATLKAPARLHELAVKFNMRAPLPNDLWVVEP